MPIFQRCGAAGTTTTVSPPVLPCSPLTPSAPIIPVDPVIPVEPVIPVGPVEPIIPVAPVSPFSAVAPAGPCGPAGPGTGTVTAAAGAAGTTTVARSHAPKTKTDSAAATTIEYFMIALSIFRTRTGRGIARSRPNFGVFPSLFEGYALSPRGMIHILSVRWDRSEVRALPLIRGNGSSVPMRCR